jgi:hypothetical protein
MNIVGIITGMINTGIITIMAIGTLIDGLMNTDLTMHTGLITTMGPGTVIAAIEGT